MKNKSFPVGALVVSIIAVFIESFVFVYEGDPDTVGVLMAAGFIFLVGFCLSMYAKSMAGPPTPSIPTGGSDKRWRSVELGQLQELTKTAETKKEYSELGTMINAYFAGAPAYLICIILCVVAIVNQWFLAAILLFNIPLCADICAELMRLDKPAFRYYKIPLMESQIKQLLSYKDELKLNLKFDIQVCVQDSLDEETGGRIPFISDDVRVMFSREGESNPQSWLCAMFSFSKNDYRGTNKPYTYFVVVIDKHKMKTSRSSFQQEVQNFSLYVSETYSNLKCELKEDENYVLVFRKDENAPIPYETLPSDLESLVRVADQLFSVRSFQ